MNDIRCLFSGLYMDKNKKENETQKNVDRFFELNKIDTFISVNF